MKDSKIRYAFITGSTGAIGSSIVEKLAKSGYAVVLFSRTMTKLEFQKKKLAQEYPSIPCTIISGDVSNPVDVKKSLIELKKQGIKFSVLVNSAGISGGGVTSEISDELWLKVINTNLNGAFFVTREMLAQDLIVDNGRIINIASTGGKQGVIYGAPYCASKHGMVGFTKALGLELARAKSGITVNAVCPGFVESEMAERVREHYSKIWDTSMSETKKRITDRVPIGRYINPGEVSSLVEYLTTSAADGITAQTLNVCGGLGNY